MEGDGNAGATVQSPTGLPVLTDVHEVYLGLRSVFRLRAVVWPAASGQTTPPKRTVRRQPRSALPAARNSPRKANT